MNKSDTIHIRVNPETKANAERLYANFGITITDAINIFLHQSVIDGGIPFKIQTHIPNKTTLAAMQETEDMINGKIKATPKDLDELFKELEV
ncbi:MAG: type II toxin-antitoxin system RelB/DinJ family antitoxin [Clostridiales bacterium]|jgi:DNA-damage-inducible protein J|nr:type II toxin-antitoxin system RelB/DinJ family antitoxin [Clostridiales bacterium]